MHILICGGGVIGAATAYFLSQRGAQVTVVERTGLANAASGKSGGFLALDWCDGSPLQNLARRSFALHAELADLLGGERDWNYRRMTTYGGHAGYSGGSAVRPVDWVSDDVVISQRLGSPETTAQVHPGAFTRAIMRAAQARGVMLRPGTVTDIVSEGGRVVGAAVHEEVIRADAVVIALGPWSILAAQWLPLPPVYGLKGHSLVFETGDRLPADALFLETADGAAHPEVFPRSNGTTYVCGYRSHAPIPVDPAQVIAEEEQSAHFETICRALSPVLRDAPICARQACYRPVTHDGMPLIGPLAGVAGAYVATGHSVWGILNAPATGEALAELIVDGEARTVDLTPFDPARLPPLPPGEVSFAR
jgi:glycine/D-amino acid oxidase-like deaminating enzyme